MKMQIEEYVGRKHQNYMYTSKKKPEFSHNFQFLY